MLKAHRDDSPHLGTFIEHTKWDVLNTNHSRSSWLLSELIDDSQILSYQIQKKTAKYSLSGCIPQRRIKEAIVGNRLEVNKGNWEIYKDNSKKF